MKRLLAFCVVLLIGFGVSGQSGKKNSSPEENQYQSDKSIADSLTSKTNKDISLGKKTGRRRLIMAADTLTPSDFILSIERVNDKLNSIRDSATLKFEIEGAKRRIDNITEDINTIRKNIRGKNSAINIKNLYLYQSFTSNLDKENDHIQKNLSKTYNRVYNSKLGLKTVLSDSVFHILYTDNNLRNTYDKKLERIERKWNRADSTTRANIDTLNAMKVKIADNAMSLSGIMNIMEMRLDKASKQLFGQEVNYLWQRANNADLESDNSDRVSNMLGGELKAIGYYFGQTSGQRVIVLIFGVLLFIWLVVKKISLKTIGDKENPFEFLHLKYMNNNPVLSLILLLLCLMPFFDAYAPTSYIAIEFLFLLSVSSVIFLKKEDIVFRFSWLTLVGLLVADTITFLLIEPTFLSRIWLLAIHSCIIVFSFLFYKKLKEDNPYYKWIKRAVVTGIVLTGLGILCNLTGRFSLSGILGLAGIFAITQAVILTAFIEIIIEIILVQLQFSRIKKGFDKPFDSSAIIKRIKMPVGIIAVFLWLIMLTSNLNIYHGITNSAVNILTTTRFIGSISFKLISILWFFIIIWLAHICQRLISFLFGETGIDTEDATPVSKKQHSRLLITRLMVLVGGYILAIAASGLPLDKLTLLLGALGVGIGMGLQNVVNNFVSGIILIFDGSLQIGDEIEISGQAGKVKEIGLRASTLSTSDGADVIIPNGNILSQNIVNWTFSNDQKRVTVWFSLMGKELDANVINEVINETIKNIPNVVTSKKPVILYTSVTSGTCSITVRFWCTINNADSVKSETMLRLSAAFDSKKIKFE